MKTKFFLNLGSEMWTIGSQVSFAVSLGFLGACAQPSRSFPSHSHTILSVSEIAKNVNNFLDEPGIEESVRNLGTAEYFAFVQSKVTDSSIEFGSYQFAGLAEQLKADEASLAEFAVTYPTMGDMFDAAGVDTFPASVTEQDIQAAASTLNNIINLGPSAARQETLELFGRKSCRVASRIKKVCGAGAAVACTLSVAGAAGGHADVPNILACIGSSMCTGIAGSIGGKKCGR